MTTTLQTQPDDTSDLFYQWRCFGTVVCDVLDDKHGRECDRMNDEARTEFYADLVADDIANLVRWHVAVALLAVPA